MPATIRTRPRARPRKPRQSRLSAEHREPTAECRERPVLIATDASSAATAAIKLSRELADRGEWTPEVITVFEQLPVSVAGMTLPAPSTQHEAVLTNNILTRIQQQLRRYGAASWKLAVQFGSAARVIVRAAGESKAEVIVLGLGRHGTLARIFGAETAVRVTRHADVPVLAVHPSTKHAPSVAVVAADFGESSTRAAREALRLLQAPGRLHLVHVKWGYNMTTLQDAEWERAYSFGVDHGFHRVIKEIGARDGIEVTTEFLHGHVVESLLGVAKSIGAQLIALGSHSQSVVDRLVIGSTPASVLRVAPCSVLVVPPNDAAT